MADDSEFEAKTAIGTFRARGYDTLTLLGIVGLVGFGYMLYMHMQEAKASNMEIASAIRDAVRVQKFTACIIATPESQKEAQYSSPQSFCNRMAQ